jgi:hypothetical protein
MQKALLFATIGLGVITFITGVVHITIAYLTSSKKSAKEGAVFLVVGICWGAVAQWPEAWNWGLPTLLICATAWNWWDKIGGRTVASKDKAE